MMIKRILIILATMLLSFGLGWWICDMRHFANGVTKDGLKGLHFKNPEVRLQSDTASNIAGGKKKQSKNKTIADYMADDQFIHWSPVHADNSGYLCEISIQKITVLYWYHGQCAYDYFTEQTSDTTLDVLWSYRADCLLDMDFLERSNGVKNHPMPRDIFATMTLINDTTMKVRYRFPEWTRKVNAIAKDSLYPVCYYLKRD